MQQLPWPSERKRVLRQSTRDLIEERFKDNTYNTNNGQYAIALAVLALVDTIQVEIKKSEDEKAFLEQKYSNSNQREQWK